MENKIMWDRIEWFIETISGLSFEVCIKGSTALFMKNKLNRKPNDIDIIIDSDFTLKDVEDKWEELLSKFDNYTILQNNHFLKSVKVMRGDDSFEIEWVVKQKIHKKHVWKYKGIKVLNPEWCLYSKIVQIYHISIHYNVLKNPKIKIQNTLSDIDFLIDDESFKLLLKDINEIIGLDWLLALFSYFSSSDTTSTKAFLNFEMFINQILKHIKTIKQNTKNQLLLLFNKINVTSKNKLFIIEYIVEHKREIMDSLTKEENIQTADVYELFKNTKTPYQKTSFKENILYFNSINNLLKPIAYILDIISYDLFDSKEHLSDQNNLLMNFQDCQNSITIEKIIHYISKVIFDTVTSQKNNIQIS